MISSIESVTVGVAELEPALRLFRDMLGLECLRDTRASVGLLSAWKRPVHESVRLVELGRTGELFGRIRLACFEEAALSEAAAQPSPAALEIPIALAAGEAMQRLEATGLAATASRALAPALRAGGGDALIFAGPGGTPLVLSTTVDGTAGEAHTAASLGARELATVCLSTNDLDGARRFYVDVLRCAVVSEGELRGAARDEAGRLLGLGAADAARFVVCASPGAEGVRIALLHAGDGAAAPEMRPGQPGVNLLSFACEDMDELMKHFEAFHVEFVTRSTHIGLPLGRPGRVMLIRGPCRELLELVEIAA